MPETVCDDDNVERYAGEPVDDGWTDTILGDPDDEQAATVPEEA